MVLCPDQTVILASRVASYIQKVFLRLEACPVAPALLAATSAIGKALYY